MMLEGSVKEVGVVIIGRNEGDRLRRALEAVRGKVTEVIYVDSNSMDGSREVAARLDATVIHLETGPYTPSRGRQVGFEELTKRRPDLKYVQFIDGDCVLNDAWIDKSEKYLVENPEVGAVFGRRREERYVESFYSRIMDIDWDHPAGDAPYFGGDSLTRIEAIQGSGGWSVNTINAEDVDLSFRIRENGWRIVRLREEMTLHDAKITRFSEYWRRSIRAGYGYAEVGMRYRHGYGKILLKRMYSALLYGGMLPIIGIVGIMVYWPVAIVVLILYIRVLVVMTNWSRKKGSKFGLSLAYALLNVICKAAALKGSSQYWLNHLTGNRITNDHLIIYRGQNRDSSSTSDAAQK